MSKRNLTELTCEQCRKVHVHDNRATYGGMATIHTWLDLRNYKGKSQHFCSAICLADSLRERLEEESG
jgi:hypothetical protein